MGVLFADLMKTALIIEDNLEIRENTTELLELAGYNVITANNGTEGIEAASMRVPDVILCDIMMPQTNGYEVLQVLKDNPITAQIPFIYVTASAEKKDINMAMEMGADGYVRKPFDVRELMDAIEKVMNR
jgi:CheY-like chemotaxis protein